MKLDDQRKHSYTIDADVRAFHDENMKKTMK